MQIPVKFHWHEALTVYLMVSIWRQPLALLGLPDMMKVLKFVAPHVLFNAAFFFSLHLLECNIYKRRSCYMCTLITMNDVAHGATYSYMPDRFVSGSLKLKVAQRYNMMWRSVVESPQR